MDGTGASTIDGNLGIEGNLYDISQTTLQINDNLHLPYKYLSLYTADNEHHSFVSKDSAGTNADDLRINTYGAMYINLDSNNNNPSAANFQIGRHGTTGAISDWLFVLDGETGNVQMDGDLTVSGNDIKSSAATAISMSNDDVSIVGCLNVGSATECTTQGNIQGVGTLSFDDGVNHKIYSSASGLLFDGGDGGDLDFLIYDDKIYAQQLLLGYTGAASLITYDAAEDLTIDPATTGDIIMVPDSTDGNVGIGTASPKTKLTVEGTMTLKEQADADTDTAAYGQIWVNTATPNELYFTDDAGGDHQLTGTSYWSCAGNHFDGRDPDIDDIYKDATGYLDIIGDNIYIRASVDLPNGAIISGAIVYGSAATEDDSWHLRRITLSGGTAVILATAVMNTEDTSISYETIDNSLYAYVFSTTGLHTNDRIYGARIIYKI